MARSSFARAAVRDVTPQRWIAWTGAALLAATVGFSAARSDDASTDSGTPAYAKAVSELVDRAYKDGNSFVGLGVAIVEDGDIKLLQTHGTTIEGGGTPITPDTVFRWASVSKTFTTTLVGMLAEQGRLGWDDPIIGYVPNFKLASPYATRAVTLERLASHQVGLPNHAYDNVLESGASVDAVLQRTSSLSLKCPPGDCHAYQNTVFSLLGDAAELADGRSFAESLQARIFDPLYMTRASVGREALQADENWARPHRLRGKRNARYWSPIYVTDSYYRVAGAGGMNGSLLDLVQWVRAHTGHAPDVVSRDLMETLHAPRVPTARQQYKMRWMRSRLDDADYGLGWRVLDYDGTDVVMHAGGVAGTRAIVGVIPERDFGFAILWNSTTSQGWRIMPAILDAYLGKTGEDWLDVDAEAVFAEIEAEAEADQERGSP